LKVCYTAGIIRLTAEDIKKFKIFGCLNNFFTFNNMPQTTTLAKLNISYAVKFLILLTMAVCAPLFGFHSQWVTGPIVNMALILSVFTLGIRGAFLIGLLPSTIALGAGLLPAILAPMIPFIIISNCLFILVLDYFKNRLSDKEIAAVDYFLAIFVSAGLKYLFLLSTSKIVAGLLLKQELAAKAADIMSYPQFFTALIGGVLAGGALKILKNAKQT